MATRIPRAIFVALLGLAFALSLTLSTAQAAAMSTAMAKMGMAGQEDCGGCSRGAGKNGAKTALCIQLCAPAVAADLLTGLEINAPQIVPEAPFVRGLELGSAPEPSPDPPRF